MAVTVPVTIVLEAVSMGQWQCGGSSDDEGRLAAVVVVIWLAERILVVESEGE